MEIENCWENDLLTVMGANRLNERYIFLWVFVCERENSRFGNGC